MASTPAVGHRNKPHEIMPKFNVYGRVLAVEKSGPGWTLFDVGSDGKRRIANDMVVPDFVGENELAQYLGDMLHEHATPGHPQVVPLPE